MTPNELFSLSGLCESINFDAVAGIYWEVEAEIADELGIGYSWLANCTPYDRQCRLCGTLCETNEFGSIPRNCDNPRCASVRTFWGIQSFPRCDIFNYRGNRGPYLRKRMERHFGASKLSEIPDEIRFEFLLSAMLERIAHESQH